MLTLPVSCHCLVACISLWWLFKIKGLCCSICICGENIQLWSCVYQRPGALLLPQVSFGLREVRQATVMIDGPNDIVFVLSCKETEKKINRDLWTATKKCCMFLLGWMDWTWCTFTLWHLSLTHHLCIFLILIQDLMKSEERQKLAKERREEKAKNLGKWKQGVGGQAHCIARELPLVLGWKRLLLCVSCVTTAPGCWWHRHAEGQRTVWASAQDQQRPNHQFTKDKRPLIC